MGMSLKQPLILIALMVLTLIGFQNCSKVGIEDLSSSDAVAAGSPLNIPADGDGDAGTLPDPDDSTPGDVVSNIPPKPPKSPPVTEDTASDKDDEDCDKDDDRNDDDKKSDDDKKADDGKKADDDKDIKSPVAQPDCRPMNQVKIKESKDSDDDKDSKGNKKGDQKISQKQEMQTVACLGNPNENCVVICHKPPGNPANSHNIMMKSSGSIQAHLAHGDSLGACAETPGTLPSDVIVCEEKDDDHHGHDYENPHDPKTKK